MEESVTLAFDVFWDWLTTHPNCILRAGTPEAVIFDDDDYHWHFATSVDDAMPVVQVLRGKRLLGEVVLVPDQVSYVQGSEGDPEGEYLFELISETEAERFVAYFFVLVHGYDGEGSYSQSRVH